MNRLLMVLKWLGARLGVVVLVAAALAGGYLLRAWVAPSAPHSHAAAAKGEEKVQWRTCSMHPQIRLPKPGNCPICAMPLIPLKPGAEGKRVFSTTPDAEALMDIQVSPVERRFVTAEVRMVGKVEYDETRLAYITAWVPGRLDRLYVDYTGITVAKGDHMVYLYSPELLASQEELLQALKVVKELKASEVGVVKETADATVTAAREKLRLLGLTVEQLREIEARGTAADHLTIYAPMGGVVLDKNAQQGMYVETGTRIYTIADLSKVWVKLDAYESDLMWIRYGQAVAFTAEAYPGETFTGKVAFIDPVVDPRTRTVKVRVNLPNPELKLKPDMFVRAVVRARVAADGRVMDPDLAGKWMCPMHPEIVKDAAGNCDVCGMPLVRTESLGYVPVDESERVKPLVIPASAPLVTGKRAVVYVKDPDAKMPTFEGREIVLGPRAGDEYIVASGLVEGEWVVTSGNFKIDSALQIQAKPSMMSPEGGAPPPGHQHGPMAAPKGPPALAAPETGGQVKSEAPEPFQKQLAALAETYFAVSDALAGDDFAKGAAATAAVEKALAAVQMELLKGDAHMAWMKELTSLKKSVEQMAAAKDIAALRAGFALLSEELPVVIRKFGIGPVGPVYVFKCPMAFNNRGATWLGKDKAVRNPYFGAQMPKCGAVVKTILDARHP